MYRWIFLFFSSVEFFAAEFFISQSPPLVGRLSGSAEGCRDGTDPNCLNFTATEFNSLIVAHYWAGAVAALLSGFCVGKYGVWLTSCGTAVFLFIGLLLFTVAPYCASTMAAFWVMMLGRILFSFGFYSHIVMAHQVKSHWFYGREMALAFALYLDSGSAGAIVALATVGQIATMVGLQSTLWITFGVGILSPLCAVIAGWIYKIYSPATLDAAVYVDATQQGDFGWRKLTQLGWAFWCIAGIIFFFFSALFTIVADMPKYLGEAYGYSEAKSGQIAGLISDIAISAPIFGYLTDRFGCRDIFNLVAAILFFFGVLCVAVIPTSLAVVACVCTGIAYSALSPGLWGSIPLVTSHANVGVAMGVGAFFLSSGSGLMLLFMGVLLDAPTLSPSKRWEIFFILVACLAGIAVVLAAISMYNDTRNPLRPLRLRHTPTPSFDKALSNNKSQADDESTPLLANGNAQIGKRLSFTAVPLM